MSTQEELEARIAAAKARQAAIADAQTTAAIAAAQAVEAKDQAYSLLDNTIQGNEENTFTAAQTFHAPVTVGVPRVAAVWAKAAANIPDANMRKAGTITDNAGHTLELPEDSTRTQDGFAQAISDSELGLTVTHSTTAYTLYDSSSPAGQEGTIGNTRKVYLDGFGYSSRLTFSLTGGKDGVVEVGQPVMLNGNVYIGHGPEGVKARCYFDVNTAYMTKAGTLTDNNPNHPLIIELPEDTARTIDSCIAEINAQGDKLEVKAIKHHGSSIYLESSVPGSFANGIVFTRTGCLSTAANGSAQTTTQGSNIQGLDEGVASEWELRQNGYPVASRQSNNVYEGVQVFNNTVAFNGTITGESFVNYIADAAFFSILPYALADTYGTRPFTFPRTQVLQLFGRNSDDFIYIGSDYSVSDPVIEQQSHNYWRNCVISQLVGSGTYRYLGGGKQTMRNVYWGMRASGSVQFAGANYSFSNIIAHNAYILLPNATSGFAVFPFCQNIQIDNLYLDLHRVTDVLVPSDVKGKFTGEVKELYGPGFPAANRGGTFFVSAHLSKRSVLLVLNSLTAPAEGTSYELTIGADGNMSDADKEEIAATVESMYDADTDTGWKVTVHYNN